MYAQVLRRDDRAVALRLVVLACVVSLVHPAAARAAWPLVSGGRVTLGFGALYSASGGGSSRHRGADIEAEAGDRVMTPLAGRVSFAGSVPGVGGGRVVAVTVESARGKITLLPLERAVVSSGAELVEGEAIGTLAASGDGSSPGTHLHVGVRTGDLYVDPLAVIGEAPVVQGEGVGEAAGAGAGAEAGQAAGAGARSAGVDLVSGTVSAPVGSVVGMAAGVSLAPRTVSASSHSHASAAGEIAPGVSIAARVAKIGGAAVASGVGAVSDRARNGAEASKACPTVLGADGVVVPVAATSPHSGDRLAAQLNELAGRARALAVRSARGLSLALLGVFAALGALWPLWRGGAGKASGKVLVSSAGEDVAAAPSR